MCIIIAKNKNVGLPIKENLKRSFDYNSDGAGFMYVDNGRVVVDKGYMTWESFEIHYDKLCHKYNDFNGKALVLHFRIGTSGTNTMENTHPYCISDNYKDLHRTKVVCDLGVVHNGIIHEYTPKSVENIHNTNDTQEFIMKYLYPLYTNYKDFYKNRYILNGLEDITGSKLAFLDKEENVYYVGNFTEDDGVMYSNTSYKPYYGNYGSGYKYFSNAWDTNTHSYVPVITSDIETDNKELANKDEYDVKDFFKLESDWYFGNNLGIKSVGTRELYIDIYTSTIYEKIENGFAKILDDAWVYDENYVEIF